ncbi:MAG: LNR domain-containing protein, partial [Chloroflexota bacterium]|nr:LNR domain-containing protein [Chloroflexota bacterium]
MKSKNIILIVTFVLVVAAVVGVGCGQSQVYQCAAGCPYTSVGDGVCDSACNNAACSYDGGDCTTGYCATGCPWSYVGDGYCDSACNVAACNYDGGDCSQCAYGCDAS